VQLALDGAPHMLQEDLALTGLPAHIEEESDDDDDDDDDYSAPAEPVYMNNYAVSPRELTRLLHKLQVQHNLLELLSHQCCRVLRVLGFQILSAFGLYLRYVDHPIDQSKQETTKCSQAFMKKLGL
jgi:hypothetical protein